MSVLGSIPPPAPGAPLDLPLERSGKGVRVAIVDSGVYAEHPHVQGVLGGTSLVSGSSPSDYVDRNGHGTAVAAAIREKVPGADLLAVKIFDRTLTAGANELARAIDWAATQGADLINLSLGTTNTAHATMTALFIG